jgi:hypothetical protein
VVTLKGDLDDTEARDVAEQLETLLASALRTTEEDRRER